MMQLRSDSFAKVHTRGHVSALMPKHQYSMSLVDARGKKIEKEFLGLPSDNKWVLAMSFIFLKFSICASATFVIIAISGFIILDSL